MKKQISWNVKNAYYMNVYSYGNWYEGWDPIVHNSDRFSSFSQIAFQRSSYLLKLDAPSTHSVPSLVQTDKLVLNVQKYIYKFGPYQFSRRHNLVSSQRLYKNERLIWVFFWGSDT